MPICDNPIYAEHKMLASTKVSIDALSKKINRNNKKAESSYVFRKILNAALEEETWIEYSTDGILKTFKTKLEACKCEFNRLFLQVYNF